MKPADVTLVCDFLRAKGHGEPMGWIMDALSSVNKEAFEANGEAILSHAETGNSQALFDLIVTQVVEYTRKNAEEWRDEQRARERAYSRRFSSRDEATGIPVHGEI